MNCCTRLHRAKIMVYSAVIIAMTNNFLNVSLHCWIFYQVFPSLGLEFSGTLWLSFLFCTPLSHGYKKKMLLINYQPEFAQLVWLGCGVKGFARGESFQRLALLLIGGACVRVLLAVCFQCGVFIVQQGMHSSVFLWKWVLDSFLFFFLLISLSSVCKYYQGLFLLIARFG